MVKPGEFRFGVIGLDHGHINGQCNGLIEAGGELTLVYDPDPAKVDSFVKRYPTAIAARSEAEVLENREIRLIASACIPCDRGPLGCRVMRHGKDYFVDKTPFTSLGQLETAKRIAAETGKKYMVYYSERLHVESAMYAGELIEQGVIGKVIQVLGLGPHRLNAPSRPDWFFKKAQYGGILTDIGSHQIEQFLHYSGAKAARVLSASVGNFNNPMYPELEDFGDAHLLADNGAVNYYRVDWFTPDGLGTWGDGRTIIIGTEGYMELRKYIDVGREKAGDHLYLVTKKGEQMLELAGKVGFPYFGRLIRDCLDRTETAMTQAHAFLAGELCLQCQEQARRVGPGSSLR